MSSQTASVSANISYSDVEKFLLERKNRKHFITSFYSLLSSSVSYDLPDFSHRWEKDLNIGYIENDWQALCNKCNFEKGTYFLNLCLHTVD